MCNLHNYQQKFLRKRFEKSFFQEHLHTVFLGNSKVQAIKIQKDFFRAKMNLVTQKLKLVNVSRILKSNSPNY